MLVPVGRVFRRCFCAVRMPRLGGETCHSDMPSQLSGMWRRGGRHATETRARQKEINILLRRFPRRVSARCSVRNCGISRLGRRISAVVRDKISLPKYTPQIARNISMYAGSQKRSAEIRQISGPGAFFRPITIYAAYGAQPQKGPRTPFFAQP